jgi:choline dehydrogenase-like flavoprotein
LGNQNDLVGRFFMEHLHFWSGLFIPSAPKMIESTAIYNEIQRINNVPVIAKLALSESVMRKERLINHNMQLIPRWVEQSKLYDHLFKDFGLNAPGRLKPLSALVRKGMVKTAKLVDRRTSLSYIIANMTEQVPNPESRVLLSQERDALGLPRVNLNWQVTRQDIANARRVHEILGKEIEANRLGRFLIQMTADALPAGLHGGYHHMGTTRMSADPKKGVVDPDSRVHGVSNLYIAGPSVFPTGGHANPVLTIAALTLRLAEHLSSRFY